MSEKSRPAIVIKAEPGSHVVGNIEKMNVTVSRDGSFVVEKAVVESEDATVGDESFDENTEESCDEVIYENIVFVQKYATYEKLKQLRTQILACLATDDKEDTTGLVELTQKNQMFLILGLLVSMRFIEEKRGYQTKFMQQMNSFFPELFSDPTAYAKSLEREVSAWSEDGHILSYGEWSRVGKGMQEKKWRKFKAIAERIKPILQKAL